MEPPLKSEASIKVSHLSHRYVAEPEAWILRDVSFGVSGGRVFCILGGNGSGKSTIINALAGLVTPSVGTATVSISTGETARVALLHQDYRQTNWPWASVEVNVEYGIGPQATVDRGGEATGESAQQLIAEFLPGVKRSTPAYRLSGGQLQLVALARALASKTDALLADEPLSAMDPTMSLAAIERVGRIVAVRRTPCVWVSHSLDEALLVGDEIGLLSREHGTFSSIMSNPVPRPRTRAALLDGAIQRLRTRIVEWYLQEAAWRSHAIHRVGG